MFMRASPGNSWLLEGLYNPEGGRYQEHPATFLSDFDGVSKGDYRLYPRRAASED